MIEKKRNNKWKCVRIFLPTSHSLALLSCFAIAENSISIFCIANSIEPNNLLMSDQNLLNIYSIHSHTNRVFSQPHIIEMLLPLPLINCTFHDYSSVSPETIKYIWYMLSLCLSVPSSFQLICIFSTFWESPPLSLYVYTLMCMKLKWKLTGHNWN